MMGRTGSMLCTQHPNLPLYIFLVRNSYKYSIVFKRDQSSELLIIILAKPLTTKIYHGMIDWRTKKVVRFHGVGSYDSEVRGCGPVFEQIKVEDGPSCTGRR